MKGFDVYYKNSAVGTVAVSEAPGGVRFDAVCTLTGDAVLRLYGTRDGRYLPIGVLAPRGGYWHIGRTLSQQTLRGHGFGDALPDTFLLSERPPQTAVTGDPLLDRAVADGTVALVCTPDGFELSCPFDPAAPCPLAFALTACRVENARAVLHIPLGQ